MQRKSAPSYVLALAEEMTVHACPDDAMQSGQGMLLPMCSQVYAKGSGTMVVLILHYFARSQALHAGEQGIVCSNNVHSAQRAWAFGPALPVSVTEHAS